MNSTDKAPTVLWEVLDPTLSLDRKRFESTEPANEFTAVEMSSTKHALLGSPRKIMLMIEPGDEL